METRGGKSMEDLIIEQLKKLNNGNQEDKEKIFELKPNFYGLGLNLKNLLRWIKIKVGKMEERKHKKYAEGKNK